ncbi:hypothetical protein [Flavobacterium restrictum]|uniref:PKD domain-containing protein n=1 Tax=Flavobacterium restrictum TaxID=2594428 RepID=A0A553DYJ5_9FLAO|nr:hypothetical protein [Flavobacterium restrictum]TRX37762.1 hypothetical protein FNW21_11755 [Flavobacterium restrictum]
MKRILHILIAVIALGSLFSCNPIEDRNSLPAITKTAATLNFTVTPDASNKNKIVMTNLDTDVIPYWSYTDKDGNELGHFNTNVAEVTLPFAGVYYVKYTGYTRGGAVDADPVKLTIGQNDAGYFSDPKWAMLTNGVAGKTWIINFVTESPFAFVGGNYINKTVEGDWSWFPGSVNDVSWSGIETKDWGQVTFDLNGGYNIAVTQTSLTAGSNVKTTSKGTYTYQRTAAFTNDRIIINGAIQMLHTNAYYTQTMSGFSFSDVRLIELTATSLRYAIIRNDGAQVVMNLVPKVAQ